MRSRFARGAQSAQEAAKEFTASVGLGFPGTQLKLNGMKHKEGSRKPEWFVQIGSQVYFMHKTVNQQDEKLWQLDRLGFAHRLGHLVYEGYKERS